MVQNFVAAAEVSDTLAMSAQIRQPDQNPQGIEISAGPRMKAALLLAILADAAQIAVFPFFLEGAASPYDDVLDICIGGVLTWLLGWHWEFAPSFVAKLIPGVDLVPLWTLAVARVYQKTKPRVAMDEGNRE